MWKKYRIYSDYQSLPVIPEKIITEDSNSGFDFFKAVGEEKRFPVKAPVENQIFFDYWNNPKGRGYV